MNEMQKSKEKTEENEQIKTENKEKEAKMKEKKENKGKIEPYQEIERIARNVEKKTGVKTSPKNIEDIMAGIKTTGNFWQIVSFSQRPIPVVAQTLKELKSLGYIDLGEEEVRLLPKFNEVFENILPFLPDAICQECEGRGINIKSLGIYDDFVSIQRDRPKPLQEYDQGNVDPASTIGRVTLMRLRGDISKKKIIVLGDDDLVGIAIGLTRIPKEVVVLDIDKRLIDFTNKVAQERGLAVRAEVFDLREPLPNSFKNKFDVFVTDPPEAKKSFRVFLEKAIWCLTGNGGVGYIGMTLIDSSVSKWRELQKIILEAGAAITDIIRNFNRYEIWDYHEKTLAWKLAPVKSPLQGIWYTSALVRIELVQKPSARNIKLKLKDMYIDSESTTT